MTRLVHVCGEHDTGSRDMVAAALQPLDGQVAVGLGSCRSLDSSVIGAILGKALELGKSGSRLELVVPRQGQIPRVVERLGVRALVPVLEETPHPITAPWP
jgi:hypothetical protein